MQPPLAANPADSLTFPLGPVPAPAETKQIVEGLYWIRMPIPIPGLDFINLWALQDQNGWTLVDTGMRSTDIRNHWERIFATTLQGQKVTRVICTHFHPDHLGQAGWLTDHWQAPLWMTLGEWSFGRMLALDSPPETPEDVITFYRQHGMEEEHLLEMRKRGYSNFARAVTEIPRHFIRLQHGQSVQIGAHTWEVIVGCGHSPEHACLYSKAQNILISGDQILPKITPHIGVYPGEPEADPLGQYLGSLSKFENLPDDVLILPSHGEPFIGLHARLTQLTHHHDKRLIALREAIKGPPKTARALAPALFRRTLDRNNISLALGETLAHIHYLIGQQELRRIVGGDGRITFATL